LQCQNTALHRIKLEETSLNLAFTDFEHEQMKTLEIFERNGRALLGTLQIVSWHGRHAQLRWKAADSLDVLLSEWLSVASFKSNQLFISKSLISFNGRKVTLTAPVEAPEFIDTDWHEACDAPAEWPEIEAELGIALAWQPQIAVTALIRPKERRIAAVSGFDFGAVTLAQGDFTRVMNPRQRLVSFTLGIPSGKTVVSALAGLAFALYLTTLIVLARSGKRPRRDASTVTLQFQACKSAVLEPPLVNPLRHADDPRATATATLSSTTASSSLPPFPAHLQLAMSRPIIKTRQTTAPLPGNIHIPSLSFALTDNRHILFPSKLRNLQK
jgi:hypothetical protein